MKAILKAEPEKGLTLTEIPTPKPEPHEVLIKTRFASICGTDLHIYDWDEWATKNVPTPMTIGHEFSGEIAELGSNVSGFSLGQRVLGEGHITCGLCKNCQSGKRHLCNETTVLGIHRPGCFAEYFTLPAENLFPLPDTISDTLGSIFDPFGNAVHTALSFPLTGEDVLITGAGPIGIMAAGVAAHAGARHVVITDINDERLTLAKTLGATTTINVNKTPLNTIETPYSFTVGLEMSGHPDGLNDLLTHLQPGGQIALLGILPPNTSIDWDLVIFKMLHMKGIYGREIFKTWHQMVHLLESGLALDPVITHTFPFDHFEEGFSEMFSGSCGKVLLSFSR